VALLAVVLAVGIQLGFATVGVVSAADPNAPVFGIAPPDGAVVTVGASHRVGFVLQATAPAGGPVYLFVTGLPGLPAAFQTTLGSGNGQYVFLPHNADAGTYYGTLTAATPNPLDGSPLVTQRTYTLVVVPDVTPPTCTLAGTGIDAAGRRFVEMTVSDAQSTLIHVGTTGATTNVTPAQVSASFPPSPGRDPSVTSYTATFARVDPAQIARVDLGATDWEFNGTTCHVVMATVRRIANKPTATSMAGVAQAAHRVTIVNGQPGVSNVLVEVNGVTFDADGLADGATRELDVAAAMQTGAGNTIAVTAVGKPNGTADVLVHE
jgi:hypothetical protein